ncbi:MAG: class I SAM-dependent methyltransferase, partial [Candidatus Rokubacteria bacterium]|nr:class I SAM-dependent methyltransferase [Candidatus Rokubacteria bacterium]
PPAPLNRLLAAVFSLEGLVVPRVSLPFGTSVLLIAHR